MSSNISAQHPKKVYVVESKIIKDNNNNSHSNPVLTPGKILKKKFFIKKRKRDGKIIGDETNEDFQFANQKSGKNKNNSKTPKTNTYKNFEELPDLDVLEQRYQPIVKKNLEGCDQQIFRLQGK